MQNLKGVWTKGYGKREINVAIYCIIAFLCIYHSHSFASAVSFKSFAVTIQETFKTVKEIMTKAAYTCGVAFSMMGITKFKAYKDNPTQIPLSTPIVLIAISSALLFLPTVFDIAGDAVFGPDATPGIRYLETPYTVS